MARAFTPKVVTANDLLEGDVIYMTGDGNWTRDHAEAKLFEDEDEAKAALAKAETQSLKLVGAYLADAVRGEDGKPEPVHFREAFRTRGPSNYPELGKQAEL
ncbi:MAG: DUF2849 domain-containing protein [Rhizobiaceae bacterium]|jgi:tartrate dehydratase beta subunit/fumarate hydratase class I family protein|nr:DUF2849 domain-containing protein [Rhizobiaceae bacterium]